MNQQQVTAGIVLARTDFGEADRIITVLTPDAGKLRLMAKGVRRVKSKLAGGVELFSVADITFLRGKGEIGTLISARLRTHYGHIVKDIDRTMAGYEITAQLNKATEDEPEPEYFRLLEQALVALNDGTLSLELIRLWFGAQLLRLGGHTPNLQTEPDGSKLVAGKAYGFSFDDAAFTARPDGKFRADDIKFLRLVFSDTPPAVLAKVTGVGIFTEQAAPLVNFMLRQYIH